MKFWQIIANVFWLLFGGLEVAFTYFVGGVILTLTVIGIPFGVKLFYIGVYALLPFGAKLKSNDPIKLPFPLLFNIIWLPFGLLVAFLHLIFGVAWLITIVGIPFGIQHFKLLSYAIFPFGRKMEY